MDPIRPESNPNKHICIWPRNRALRPCGPPRVRPLPPERWRGSRPAGHCSPREDPAGPESSPNRQICIWPRNPALRPCGPPRVRPLLPEKWPGRRPAGPFAPREDRMRRNITNAAQNGRAGIDARPGPVGCLRGFGGSLGDGRGKGGRGGGRVNPLPCSRLGACVLCFLDFWLVPWLSRARAPCFPATQGPGTARVCLFHLKSFFFLAGRSVLSGAYPWVSLSRWFPGVGPSLDGGLQRAPVHTRGAL